MMTRKMKKRQPQVITWSLKQNTDVITIQKEQKLMFFLNKTNMCHKRHPCASIVGGRTNPIIDKFLKFNETILIKNLFCFALRCWQSYSDKNSDPFYRIFFLYLLFTSWFSMRYLLYLKKWVMHLKIKKKNPFNILAVLLLQKKTMQ